MNELPMPFCPHCGRKTLMRSEPNRVLCPSCTFEQYLNTAAAVCAIIVDQTGKLLVTVRAKDPEKGAWDLPGGFVDPGESAEQALTREIREELGLELMSAQYIDSEPNIYPYKGLFYHTVDLAFACSVHNPNEARAMDDVQGLCLVDTQAMDLNQFGFTSVRRICARYFNIGLSP